MTRHMMTIHCIQGCARRLIGGRAGFRSAPPSRSRTVAGAPDVDRPIGHTPLSVGGSMVADTRSGGHRTLTSPERRSYLYLPVCSPSEQADSHEQRV